MTPATSDANATLAYLGANDEPLADADAATDGHQVTLAVGPNTIRIEVTAADDTTTQTYTVVITRKAAVSIAAVASAVDEGAEVEFTLTRNGPTDAALTVSVAVTQEGEVLTTPGDYAALVAVTIPAGADSQPLNVDTDDDRVVEALVDAAALAGRITATVRSGDAYEASTDDDATVDVNDNDTPEWSLSVDPDTIAEDGGTSTVTVSPGDVTFAQDQTVTLTLAGTATAGTDYTLSAEGQTLSSPYELTLTAGADSAEAMVTASADTAKEATRRSSSRPNTAMRPRATRRRSRSTTTTPRWCFRLRRRPLKRTTARCR